MTIDTSYLPPATDVTTPRHNLPVLLLPPTSRDGAAIESLLSRSNIECRNFSTMSDLCAGIAQGTGVVIISEESLPQGGPQLAACVSGQSVWSDLPVLVLSRAGTESPRFAANLAGLGNVSVIERPVRVSTFLSMVASALRARLRQYEVRDHLEDQRRSAEDRERLLESERAARSDAERISRVKDEFLATLSHELRTPLNAIVGWCDIIHTITPKAPEVTEGIEVIERNARIQTQIIEDLLDMSRIISGKLRLNMQRTELSKVIQAAAETVLPAASAKEIQLDLDLDPLIKPISGDPNRLQQVFWNLLSNAIKFTPHGGRVRVRVTQDAAQSTVSIIDSGVGIEPQFLPHVFDRFTQADASTTRRYGGLGLGLAIVKQLVEIHGGTITAQSNGKNQGSTFSVSLPLNAAHADPEPVSLSHQVVPGSASFCNGSNPEIMGIRVLIVDDERDSRAVLRRLLEDRHAVVIEAANAQEAFARLTTERPDLLISDIGMPGEDGYSLIRKIRNLTTQAGGDTPAIALTAYARSEDRARAASEGFQQHLSKPIQPNALMAAIDGLARRAPAHNG